MYTNINHRNRPTALLETAHGCSLDEPRDRWRPLFRARLPALVAEAHSLTEAAVTLNARVWALWGIRFRADSTPDVLSPFQARHAGSQTKDMHLVGYLPYNKCLCQTA